jgi:F-type H+-transporting ATPase subunit delta
MLRSLPVSRSFSFSVPKLSIKHGSSQHLFSRRSYATEADRKTLRLSFAVPHRAIYENKKVDIVTVPGVAGDFGVLAEHVPVISQLRPGVVSIIHEQGKEEKWFVPAGFVFVESDSSMAISACEAFPVSEIDATAARRGLEKFTQLQNTATNEKDKAKAAIGVELFTAMLVAAS